MLSLLVFVMLLYWIGQIYLSNKKKFRVVEIERGEYYLLSQNMYFIILTVCTGPIFLHSISMLKYGLWLIVVLFLLLVNKVRIKLEIITMTYILFYFWLCCAMTYTSAPRDGYMLLIKYIIPILFLWLGYSSINNEKDLIIFLKVVNWVACFYCILVGGQGYKLFPWIYWGPIGTLFIKYAGFADFLTSIFVVPVLLYFLTKEKKYIFCALWMVFSTVLQSVRTGMGGMLIVFVMALVLRYKVKAIPGVLLAGGLFLSVVLFVPEVNEKFFGEDAGAVSATDIVQGDAMSMDNINTNGRSGIWEMILEECYSGNEIMGSGLGESMRFLKDWGIKMNSVAIMHNDYVQIISDTGIVGIVLIVSFYIVFLLKGIIYVMLRRGSACIKLTGIMAVSSMAGIAFSMYYDNVVSHSMSSLVMPFIFLGFFLKFIDLDENKRLSK